MTKREFIQQAAIQIAATLTRCYHKTHGSWLPELAIRKEIPENTMSIVNRLADEVGKSQSWDFDLDDLDIDEEVSTEDSV